MAKTQKNPLAKNFDVVSLIRFVFLSMVIMLLMGLYTMAGTIFAARFVGTNALSSIVFLFALLGGESIAKVFAENNRNVFEITKNGFAICSFSFLFSGCNIFASALFTALSNGRASAAIIFSAGIWVYYSVPPSLA
jgi:Na+-driven multidrug efflux pump